VIVGPLPPTEPKIIVVNVDLVDVAAPKKSVCFLEQRMKIPNEEEVLKAKKDLGLDEK